MNNYYMNLIYHLKDKTTLIFGANTSGTVDFVWTASDGRKIIETELYKDDIENLENIMEKLKEYVKECDKKEMKIEARNG